MSIGFGWWDHFERQKGLPLGQQYLERIELVRFAETLGIDGYSIAEHHFSDLALAPSPLVFLAALAQATSRIRLGSLVLCLPMYHPTRLLQELCMVDQLSGGRLDVGVGRGVRDTDHFWFNSDPMDSKARFAETFDILRQGLETGRLNHRGKYYQYDDVPVRFTACQKQLRFWYAGNMQFAAENGMSWVGGGDRAGIDEYWKIFNEGLRRNDARFAGPPPRVGSTRHLYIAASDDEAKAVARRAWEVSGDNFWSTTVQREGIIYPKGSLPFGGVENFDAMNEAGVIVAGSPEMVARRLLHVVEQGGPGYNYLVNAFQWGDITHAQAKSSLTLFARHVMPLIREARRSS